MPTRVSKTLAESARYPIEIFYSEDDEGFIAIARDLPGCSALGKTYIQAAEEIEHAIKAWLQAAKAANNPIPEPSRAPHDQLPSGKVLLRLPRTLHAALIECAKYEGVSLNQQLVSLLSAGTSISQITQGAIRTALVSMPRPVIPGAMPAAETVFSIPRVFNFGGASLHSHVLKYHHAFQTVQVTGQQRQETVRAEQVLDLLVLPPNVPVIKSEGW